MIVFSFFLKFDSFFSIHCKEDADQDVVVVDDNDNDDDDQHVKDDDDEVGDSEGKES